MKRLKSYKKTSKGSKIEEPSAAYGKAKSDNLVFFNSFNEMNESDIKEMGELTATERFQHITFIVQSMYEDELKRKIKSLRLHFQ